MLFRSGGIVLALCMMGVAKFYQKMMNAKVFFFITALVEWVMLLMIVVFLYFSYSYIMALFIYASYQLTFIFGGYLMRVETLALKKAKSLSIVDVVKQKGYIIGLFNAFCLYKFCEWTNISQKEEQVYWLHVELFFVQIMVVYLIYRSFKK